MMCISIHVTPPLLNPLIPGDSAFCTFPFDGRGTCLFVGVADPEDPLDEGFRGSLGVGNELGREAAMRDVCCELYQHKLPFCEQIL